MVKDEIRLFVYISLHLILYEANIGHNGCSLIAVKHCNCIYRVGTSPLIIDQSTDRRRALPVLKIFAAIISLERKHSITAACHPKLKSLLNNFNRNTGSSSPHLCAGILEKPVPLVIFDVGIMQQYTAQWVLRPSKWSCTVCYQALQMPSPLSIS